MSARSRRINATWKGVTPTARSERSTRFCSSSRNAGWRTQASLPCSAAAIMRSSLAPPLPPSCCTRRLTEAGFADAIAAPFVA
jgi:hypothetical protein